MASGFQVITPNKKTSLETDLCDVKHGAVLRLQLLHISRYSNNGRHLGQLATFTDHSLNFQLIVTQLPNQILQPGKAQC